MNLNITRMIGRDQVLPMSLLLILLACQSGQVCSQESKQQLEADSSVVELSEKSKKLEAIREKLNLSREFKYDETPFEEVRTELTEELGVDIVIDEGLEGILDDDTSVSVSLNSIRVADGMRIMLRRLDATYMIRDGVIRIISSSKEYDLEFLTRRMIDVFDLLRWVKEREPNRIGMELGSGGNVLGADSTTGREVVTPEYLLVSTIANSVSPDTWEQTGGGDGMIQCIGGMLIVLSTEEVGENVESFVADLKFRSSKRRK